MLALNRSHALVLLSLLGLFAIPMAFAYVANPVGDPSSVAAILLLVELGAYFVGTLFTNSRISILVAAALSISMVIVRVFFCILALVLSGIFRPEASMDTVLALTSLLGNPVAALIHVIFVMVATIHVIDTLMPGCFSEETTRKINGVTQVAPAGPSLADIRQTIHESAAPKGGFIQVFSYEELAAVIKKSQGLEGFVILSKEGLPVWRDLPARVNVESLTAAVASAADRAGNSLSMGGLTRGNAMLVESRDHLVYTSTLDENFALILIYNTRVSASDCLARTGIVAKTTKEFLQWKYPVLPPMRSVPSN